MGLFRKKTKRKKLRTSNYRPVQVFKNRKQVGTILLKKDKRTRSGMRVKSWSYNKGSKTAKRAVLKKKNLLIKQTQS